MKATLVEFMKDLTQLCVKHNVTLNGCGCCGSPFIQDSNGCIVADRIFASCKGHYSGETAAGDEIKGEIKQ